MLFHVTAGDGVALMRAERDEVAAILGVLDDAVCVLAVGIDATDAAGVENFELGGKIVLKIRMLDGTDVVAADIQKCADIKRDAAHTAVFERLGRGLHHKMRNAGLVGVFKVLIKLKHLWRGDMGFLAYLAVVVVDGGEDGALIPVLCAQPVVQNVAHIVGGGALALGARDADARELVRHVIIKELPEHNEGVADVADEDAGRVNIVLLLGDIGKSAVRERIAQVFLLEMRALADEERVFVQRARIIGQAFDPALQKLVGSGAAGQDTGLAQGNDVFL